MATEVGTAPAVFVDDDDSNQADLVPSFDQERERYGVPQAVEKGDFNQLTSPYNDAKSSSEDNFSAVPTPLQNENSMNVHLSKSFADDVRGPLPSAPDEGGDSFHKEADDMPNFDVDTEKYGKPTTLGVDFMGKITNNYNDAQSPNPSPHEELLANPVVDGSANQNSMRVELSLSGEEKTKRSKQTSKKHKHKPRLSKQKSKTGSSQDVSSAGPSASTKDVRKQSESDGNSEDEDLKSKLKNVTCCIK